MEKSVFKFTVRDICEIAVLCALAIVCDTFVKIPVGSTGGSINFSVAILFVIALRHGWFKGLISGGVVFGLITCLIDGYGFNTYPMEYFVAFGAVCILGILGKKIYAWFNDKKASSKVIAYCVTIACIALQIVIRFFAASVDSVLFYESSWSGAFAYNAPYVFISGAFDAIIMCILLPVVMMLNKRFKPGYLSESAKSSDTEEKAE